MITERLGCVVVSDRAEMYLPNTLEILAETLPAGLPLHVVDDRRHKLGLGGAVRAAWQIALDEGWDYLLHWEEDFRPLDRLPLAEMMDALARYPDLSQVVLKRQPWSVEERMAGGIMEQAPHLYLERAVPDVDATQYWLTVHRRIFSLNPCLVPRRILEMGWPEAGNEAAMTWLLNQSDTHLCAFYGRRKDAPRVWHVGDTRGSGWKL